MRITTDQHFLDDAGVKSVDKFASGACASIQVTLSRAHDRFTSPTRSARWLPFRVDRIECMAAGAMRLSAVASGHGVAAHQIFAAIDGLQVLRVNASHLS